MRATTSILLAASLCLGTACASKAPVVENRGRLNGSLEMLSRRDLSGIDRTMNALLENTQSGIQENALQRFFASWFLVQAHTRAALLGAFRFEKTRTSRIAGVEAGAERSSNTGHLVAAVYHATQAREIYAAANRSEATREGQALLPEALEEYGVETATVNLQIVLAATYYRLGFVNEVEKALDHHPELLRPETCLPALRRYRIPVELSSWVALMVYDHLKTRDEETAYRFGIIAVEGSQRFGQALPADEVAKVEDWILNGASVQFVCPKSQTPYIPGETKSPLSGIGHYDYVALERR